MCRYDLRSQGQPTLVEASCDLASCDVPEWSQSRVSHPPVPEVGQAEKLRGAITKSAAVCDQSAQANGNVGSTHSMAKLLQLSNTLRYLERDPVQGRQQPVCLTSQKLHTGPVSSTTNHGSEQQLLHEVDGGSLSSCTVLSQPVTNTDSAQSARFMAASSKSSADSGKLGFLQTQQQLQQWQQGHKERITHLFSPCSTTNTDRLLPDIEAPPSMHQPAEILSHDSDAQASSLKLCDTHPHPASYASAVVDGPVHKQQHAGSWRRLQTLSSQDMTALFSQQASLPWLDATPQTIIQQASSLLPVFQELDALAEHIPDPFAASARDVAPPLLCVADEAGDLSMPEADMSIALHEGQVEQHATAVSCVPFGQDARLVQARAGGADMQCRSAQPQQREPVLQVSTCQQMNADVQSSLVMPLCKPSRASDSRASKSRASDSRLSDGTRSDSRDSDSSALGRNEGGPTTYSRNAAAPACAPQLGGWPAIPAASRHKLRHGTPLRNAALKVAAKAAALAAKADVEQATPACIAFHSKAARHALAAAEAAMAAAAATTSESELTCWQDDQQVTPSHGGASGTDAALKVQVHAHVQ